MTGKSISLEATIAQIVASAVTLTPEQQEKLVEAVAGGVRERFDVRVKAQSSADAPPALAVGQTWRNKQSDRLVKIVRIDTGYNSGVRWEALTGRGPKTGRVWQHYWTSRFEFVEHGTDAGAPSAATP